MEQQKLPNTTAALILAISSFVGCCCCAGIGGIVMSGISLFLVSKDTKLYAENPELYSNYGQLKTAKIIAIIGLALSVIATIILIVQISAAGGWDAYMEQQQDVWEQLGFEI